MTTPLRVLIVDDEETLRTHLAAYLEDSDFDVTAVASGEAALNALAEGTFDIGIIDIRLPDIDGNGLVLRCHEICPSMRFLVHTASASYKPPDALAACGVRQEHVMVKPILDLDTLVQAIHRIA
ncbi:MAG: response regulator [Phycisphaerales bacterium]|nr:MAG: response regulator [Phycisphaerales bacterium]